MRSGLDWADGLQDCEGGLLVAEPRMEGARGCERRCEVRRVDGASAHEGRPSRHTLVVDLSVDCQ